MRQEEALPGPPLGAYGLMAERHWKENLPEYHRVLTEEGMLAAQLALAEAQAKGAVDQRMREIMAKDGGLGEEGRRMGFSQSAYKAAEEEVLPAFILIPPEDEAGLLESLEDQTRLPSPA